MVYTLRYQITNDFDNTDMSLPFEMVGDIANEEVIYEINSYMKDDTLICELVKLW